MKYSIVLYKGTPTLVLEGAWQDELLQVMDLNNVHGLWINVARGFEGEDIDFINRISGLEYLLVSDYRLSDVSPINHIRSLRRLNLGHGKYKGIDFATLTGLEDLWVDKIINPASVSKCVSLKKLSMGSYPEKDITPLVPLVDITKLQIRMSPLVALNGVQAFKYITSFEVYRLTKLTDISALSGCPGLIMLGIETCKKIGDIGALAQLTNLKRLDFSGCGNIESLAPLANMTELVDLIFDDDTNIVDGNLDPLLKLRKLQYTQFEDRSHYNHKLREFPRSATCQISTNW